MILSGAGLSAQSGIRTFRDHDGMWEEFDVMEVCSTQGWEKDREKVTRFYNMRRRDLSDKVPNAAHQTIARLEAAFPGRIWNLTQNVDDLLERAGCREVVHLHGTLRDLRCEGCGHTWDIGYEAQPEDASCPQCRHGSIRHNVVMFGEAAPAYRFIRQGLEESVLFIAIGSSGQVIDIAALAQWCKGESLFVGPKRERHVTAFGDHEKYVDEFFSDALLMTATDAAPELERRVAMALGE